MPTEQYEGARLWHFMNVGTSPEDKAIVHEYEQLFGPVPYEYLLRGEGKAEIINRIASARKPAGARARSGSPAVPQPNAGGGGGMFGNPMQQQAPPMNPFNSSNINFSFGGPPQSQKNGDGAGAFQFGAPAPAPNQPQQNGTQNAFSQPANPSFGSFNSSVSQPQQNGFASSTSMFNQSSQPSNNSFQFGQTQSTQPNGTRTPSTSFGGFGSQPQQTNANGTSNFGLGNAQQEKQDPKPNNGIAGFGQSQAQEVKPANVFNGFGQKAQENGNNATTPFGSFGQSQDNGNHSNTASTGLAGFGQQRQENGQQANSLFLGFGQQKSLGLEPQKMTFGGTGQKPAESSNQSANTFTGFGQSQKENEKPSTSFQGFSAQTAAENNKGAGLFNLGQKPAEHTTKPTKSLFNASQAPQSSTPVSGLFGAEPAPKEPVKSTGSLFDNLPKKDLSNGGKPLFDSSQAYREGEDDEDTQSANNGKAELFPKLQADAGKAPESQAPKTSIFAAFEQSQGGQSTSKSLFNNGPLLPTSNSQQDTSMTTSTQSSQKPLFSQTAGHGAAPSGTPATQPPRSLFDRIDPNAAKLPRESINETGKASFINTAPAPPSTSKPLFPPAASTTSTSTASTPSLFQKLPPAAPAESQTPKAAPPKNIFTQLSAAAPVTPASATSASAATFKAPPATAPVARTLAPSSTSAAQAQSSSTTIKLTAGQQQNFRELNEGLLAHLRNADPSTDWSATLRYSLIVSAQIAGRPPPSDTDLNPALINRPQPPAPSPGSSGDASSTATAKAAPPSAGLGSQAPAATTSSAGSSGNMFVQTPQASAFSLFSQPPATAPANKKRLFEEDDGLAQPPATEVKRSKLNDSTQYPKLPDTASNTAKLFASTLDKPKAAEQAASSGFNPLNKPASASGGFTPNFGGAASTSSAVGFKPTGATAGSALSAFGSLAQSQAEKDRQKRKDEDYDSDEETEEQWEARDRAKQETERAKIEEAKKSAKGFTVTSITQSASPSKPPTAATMEKAQGTGDKTWTPETPIKFDFSKSTSATTSNTPAGAPRNLFGLGSSSMSETGKLAPPATAYTFSSKTSSLNASRATTPGVTTDGEASTADKDNEDAAEGQEEAQADDQTGLLPEERQTNNVIAELHDVKTQKQETDEDSQKKMWKPKGFGTVYLLKEKETGKTRILSRVGMGKIALNYAPLKGAKYVVHSQKDTIVIGPFVDHLHADPPALGQFLLTCANGEDAKELARILTEGTPQ